MMNHWHPKTYLLSVIPESLNTELKHKYFQCSFAEGKLLRLSYKYKDVLRNSDSVSLIIHRRVAKMPFSNFNDNM